MFDYRVHFDSPQYLLLLALAPLLWWMGRRSLAALGKPRRIAALVLRIALLVLFVAALGEMQLVRVSDRVAVFYLVDRSLSVSDEQVQKVVEYINASTERDLDLARGDQAGVIGFGQQAAIEMPLVDGKWKLGTQFETAVEGQATNLAEALQLAQASFPAGFAKRIVVISDGAENVGDALRQAQISAAQGIGIDVVPLARTSRADAAVEKIVLPNQVRRDTPFEVRIVARAHGLPDGQREVPGRLKITRTSGEQTELVAEQPVKLGAERRVFAFQEELKTPDFYTYEAQFIPDDAAGDFFAQNNTASAFTQIHGAAQILLIENWAAPGQFAAFADRLRKERFQVTVRGSDLPFSNLAELQRFDAVILADVPRASGEDADKISNFSDDQIEMLVRNTREMGSGLIMLGGPDSFGAGGWTDSQLEKAMPVDFQIKSAKVTPTGALVLVIDRSGSMSGEKLQLSKAAAVAAVRVLGPRDFVGVVAFDDQAQWVVPPQQIRSKEAIIKRIASIGEGGGTDLLPGMEEAYKKILPLDAAVKHVIVLTDGQTPPGNHTQLAAAMRQKQITTTGIAVGQDADSQLLNAIARQGGGKFYRVLDPRAIPRIFMKEAMRVARPLIYENKQGVPVQKTQEHEMLRGMDDVWPPVTGFVMTTPKDHPLVEISAKAKGPSQENSTILASWQYGLGRAVAFTTDTGARWAKAWPAWEGGDKLFAQMVRWAMRPGRDDDQLLLFTDVKEGRGEIVVSALDAEGQFLNFLEPLASVVDPQLRAHEVPLKQIAPGRYVAEFDATQPGNYFISVSAVPGKAPVRGGVNVPYSDEFRDVESNVELLTSLAETAPAGGVAGEVIAEPTAADPAAASLAVNVFRPDLPRGVSLRDVWPQVMFVACCLFLVDVVNRRVAFSFAPVAAGWSYLLARFGRKPSAPEASEPMARLRAVKSQATQAADSRRAAARFTADEEVSPAAALDEPAAHSAASAKPAAPMTPDAPAEQTYTERLLSAKKRAQRNRDAR